MWLTILIGVTLVVAAGFVVAMVRGARNGDPDEHARAEWAEWNPRRHP